MTVATDDILRVAARLNVQAIGDFVNVYHFSWEGVAPIADSDAIAYCAARVDAAMGFVNTQISNDATYVDVNVFNVTQNRPLGSIPWPTRTIGGHADETLPSQVAAFVRFTTGISRNWAKKFIAPFTSAANTASGLIETAALTAITNYANEVLDSTLGTAADSMVFVVRHALTNTWNTPQEAIIRNVWSTIRTRRAGRGA